MAEFQTKWTHNLYLCARESLQIKQHINKHPTTAKIYLQRFARVVNGLSASA